MLLIYDCKFNTFSSFHALCLVPLISVCKGKENVSNTMADLPDNFSFNLKTTFRGE